MTRTIAIGAVIALSMTSMANADITVTSTIGGKAMGRDMSSQSITYIKGTKMRTETQGTVMIMDATTRQMIVVNDKKKEAEVFDMAKLQGEIQKAVGTAEPKVSFTATGQKKQVNGVSCDGYTLTITVPITMGNDTMHLTLSGPTWIAKGAPGTKDYAAFYRAAAQNGLFFGNPQQAKQQGAQLKSTTEMYKAFAAAGGIPYESEMQMKFEGTGPMASMMDKIGGVTTTTTVTSVTTGAIPDEKFAVPAGYKTTNR